MGQGPVDVLDNAMFCPSLAIRSRNNMYCAETHDTGTRLLPVHKIASKTTAYTANIDVAKPTKRNAVYDAQCLLSTRFLTHFWRSDSLHIVPSPAPHRAVDGLYINSRSLIT